MTDYKHKDEMSIVEIDDQIKLRRKIISEMVGQLYPQVIQGEIDELMELKKKKLKQGNLKYDVISKSST